VLRALDVQWADADESVRGAYLDRLIAVDQPSLRAQAFTVGAAWAPHVYLERAREDADEDIRSWAESELGRL